MIHAELISTTVLNDSFHSYVEQLTGSNTASSVQGGKRPKSKLALTLAYYKAFLEPRGDTSDVKALFSMLHFGMLCAGSELDMSEVSGWPHSLRCLQKPLVRRGVLAFILTGDGEQWQSAIRINTGNQVIKEWQDACLRQFDKYDLGEFIK